mmetsp:Transcript_73754/g.240209  ORF Transcript_73754/g.240209 Transcript_73754/m.240209 type:complete len:219 (-) Transcript_73754:486-1142(-)
MLPARTFQPQNEKVLRSAPGPEEEEAAALLRGRLLRRRRHRRRRRHSPRRPLQLVAMVSVARRRGRRYSGATAELERLHGERRSAATCSASGAMHQSRKSGRARRRRRSARRRNSPSSSTIGWRHAPCLMDSPCPVCWSANRKVISVWAASRALGSTTSTAERPSTRRPHFRTRRRHSMARGSTLCGPFWTWASCRSRVMRPSDMNSGKQACTCRRMF